MPERADGHRRLGDLFEGKGDTESAAQSYRRAAACAPDTPASQVSLAKALILEGDPQQAEIAVRHAIALDPNADAAHKVLSDVLAQDGRFGEAVAAYDHAIGLNPAQAPAYLGVVRARRCTEADRPRLAQMLARLGDAASATKTGFLSISPAASCSMICASTRRRCGISRWPTGCGAGRRNLIGWRSRRNAIGSRSASLRSS
jgi:tetratricopeptide (TPR) repeat protein